MKSTLLFAASLSLLAHGAGAAITPDIQADMLQTATSGQPAPTSTHVLLVADTAGDGFAANTALAPGASLGSGSGNATVSPAFLGGTDDLIVYRMDLTANATPGFLFEFSTPLSLGTYLGQDWNAGDKLALVWFPTLSIGSTATAAGNPFGIFSQPTSPDAGSPWVTPADGVSSYAIYGYTLNGTILPGSTSNESLRANKTVAVPEPATYAALLGALALGAVMWRRRKA